MHNLGSDGERTSRDPAFRRSDNESSAEHFSGALAVQLHRKKEPHFNGGFGIQGPSAAN
jgi:hypothetical protein